MDSPEALWPYEDDRVYHGIMHDNVPGKRPQILVELAEFGPTERAHPIVIRELHPVVANYSFGWGHIGGGPNATAEVILRDALGEAPFRPLQLDFCEDVVSLLGSTFYLRRGAVLRWVRGWMAGENTPVAPESTVRLPPVDRERYERRPPHIWEQKRKMQSAR